MANLGKYLNGHKMCAVDGETSGLKPAFSDLIQIAVVPLNSDFTVDKTVNPFYTKLVPKRPHNWHEDALTVNKLRLEDCVRYGLDPWVAADLFDEWFQKLNLGWNKRIIPVGHNYPFDRDFILDWLGGYETYNGIFSGHFRDSQAYALQKNDEANWRTEPVPYAKVGLSYLCKQLNVTLDDAHDALADAVAAAHCYKAMLDLSL